MKTLKIISLLILLPALFPLNVSAAGWATYIFNKPGETTSRGNIEVISGAQIGFTYGGLPVKGNGHGTVTMEVYSPDGSLIGSGFSRVSSTSNEDATPLIIKLKINPISGEGSSYCEQLDKVLKCTSYAGSENQINHAVIVNVQGSLNVIKAAGLEVTGNGRAELVYSYENEDESAPPL